MNKKSELLQLIPRQAILPLFFNKDAVVSVEILKALYLAGIKAVEYTNRGEEALNNFRLMRKVCEAELPGMYLGIGTIKNAVSAKVFIDAGADFIISPGLSEDVAKVADEQELLWVPGGMTPTEIIRAEQLGARLIKLFPGSLLGPSYLSAIKEIFPGLMFMPTGGVEAEEENLKDWFKAGVVAVGMGSKLITKEIIAQKDFEGLKHNVEAALQLVQKVAANPLSKS